MTIEGWLTGESDQSWRKDTPMNIPVTFLQQDGSDRFLVPVQVVTSPPAALPHDEGSTSHIGFPEAVRDGLAELARRSWNVQLPHRRYRRRQRARLRLSFS
jgi:hypothetical protein